MSDVVVTVPKDKWADWIAEGDAAGEPRTNDDVFYYFTIQNLIPVIAPGERVYIVAHGRLRGYAPLVRVGRVHGRLSLIREGGAVAVTIKRPIQGFRGWRYRDWERVDEIPFPDWKTEGVTPSK